MQSTIAKNDDDICKINEKIKQQDPEQERHYKAMYSVSSILVRVYTLFTHTRTHTNTTHTHTHSQALSLSLTHTQTHTLIQTRTLTNIST